MAKRIFMYISRTPHSFTKAERTFALKDFFDYAKGLGYGGVKELHVKKVKMDGRWATEFSGIPIERNDGPPMYV